MKYFTLLMVVLSGSIAFSQTPEKPASAPVQQTQSEDVVSSDKKSPQEDASLPQSAGKETAVKQDESKTKGNAKDAAASEKKAKKETPVQEVTPYPLDTCIVTGNELGSMGDPVTFIHEKQEIKVCCKPCEKKFLKDPAKYLPNLNPKS